LSANVGRDRADYLKRMLAYSTSPTSASSCWGLWPARPTATRPALYYTLVYVLVALGSSGVILLASAKGFGGGPAQDYRACTSAIRRWRWAMMVLMFSDRRSAAAGRLLGEELPDLSGAVGNPPPVAGGHRGRHLRGGRLLLPVRVIKLMYFDEPAPHLPPGAGCAGVRWRWD